MDERVDLSLSDDLAEVRREIQKRVDRVVAARVELDAAIADLADGREQVLSKSAAAVAFIDAFNNPLAANPPPLEPEVAAPPPAVEPPVFTTVTEPEAAPTNTSGGSAASVDPGNVIVLPETQPTPEAVAADPAPPELVAIVEAGAEAVAEHNEAAAEAAAEASSEAAAEAGGELSQKAPKADDVNAIPAADAENPPGTTVIEGRPESN